MFVSRSRNVCRKTARTQIEAFELWNVKAETGGKKTWGVLNIYVKWKAPQRLNPPSTINSWGISFGLLLYWNPGFLLSTSSTNNIKTSLLISVKCPLVASIRRPNREEEKEAKEKHNSVVGGSSCFCRKGLVTWYSWRLAIEFSALVILIKIDKKFRL